MTQGDMSKSSVPALMPSYYSWLFPHDVMAQVCAFRAAARFPLDDLSTRARLTRRSSSPLQWLEYANDSKHPQADGTFLQAPLSSVDCPLSPSLTNASHTRSCSSLR